MTSKSIKWLHRVWSALAIALLIVAASPVQATETLTFIHTDVAGSPVAATDINGDVIWREGYRPYGERTRNESAAAGNRQFFHGKAFDADTGLSYFGARYYDPVVGRFMGVDAQGFDEKNLHSFNRYAYGNNNPYKYLDSDGNAAFLIFLIPVVKGMIAGAATAGGLALAADTVSQWAAFGNFADVSLRGAAQEAAPSAAAGAVGGAIGGGAAVAWAARQASKGAQEAIVIGEGMADRVIPTAQARGASWYNPTKTPPEKWMENNRRWINEKMDQGCRILDCGPAPGRANYPNPTSPYYKTELEQINQRGYQNYERIKAVGE